jgi:hypothetical protein
LQIFEAFLYHDNRIDTPANKEDAFICKPLPAKFD